MKNSEQKEINHQSNKSPQIVFLFGAGAEQNLGFPSGADYTKETLLTKKEKMYEALATFYRQRMINGYTKPYTRLFLFSKNSHTLKEILFLAAQNAYENEKFDACDPDTLRFYECAVKNRGKKLTDELDEIYEELYNYFIYTESPKGKDSTENERYTSLRKNLVYYGAVEKDFATINHPQRGGSDRFWRLINYYWSAFFSIFIPLCRQISPSWYPQNDQNDSVITQKQYEEILKDFPNRIKEVIESALNNETLFNNVKMTGGYYPVIKKAFPSCKAITTNYTPFVERYFGKQSIYLSGKLSEFEFPTELKIEDILSNVDQDKWNKAVVFPFLMTQAPIKPIVAPPQIRQYAKAIEALDAANYLVIIGYSLGEEDNHIISMLREYITSENKRLIYCKHWTKLEPINIQEEKRKVLEKLRIESERQTDNIIIIPNNGIADDVIETIKQYL